MKFCLDDEKIPLGFEIFLLKKLVFIIITCRIVENSKIIRFPFGWENDGKIVGFQVCSRDWDCWVLVKLMPTNGQRK